MKVGSKSFNFYLIYDFNLVVVIFILYFNVENVLKSQKHHFVTKNLILVFSKCFRAGFGAFSTFKFKVIGGTN